MNKDSETSFVPFLYYLFVFVLVLYEQSPQEPVVPEVQLVSRWPSDPITSGPPSPTFALSSRRTNMGSSHSRPARSRPSTSTSASDGERPAVRRRLDPLRRLSTLGRRGIYGNGNKRDRPHSSAEDERDKRRRTSDSDDADEDDDLPEADGSRGRDSGAEEGEGGGDPLALERTRTIDTIRQALGDDWTPPSPTLTRSPSPPVVNARATPCFPTVPGPPVTTTLATPAPPPRSARPLFTPTPGVTRRWSTSYDPAPPLRGAEDGYIPLSRTQSELPPLAFLHPARGQSRMPGWYRARATDRLRAMSNERHTLSQRLQELRAEIDRQGIAGPQRPDGQGSGGADGAAAAEAPGAAIMIQGLAQMQHNPRPQPRGRWRRRGSVDAASAEQANAIASLLVYVRSSLLFLPSLTIGPAHTSPLVVSYMPEEKTD